jgi:hypothetical protein
LEFQSNATHLQWRIVGDLVWEDLVALADITGPEGPAGTAAVSSDAGQLAKLGTDSLILVSSTDVAPAAKGVTNGDSHDHSGGDGAQIAYSSLSGTPTLGTAAAAATSDFAAASHNQAETTITFTDVATGNASTTAHGYAPKATAPAAGLVSVLAIGNGETVRSDKALFDTTNPAALGSVGPGTAVVAARRDHVHAMPSAANVGAAAATSFIAGAGALTGPAAPLTVGTAAAAATGDFAAASHAHGNLTSAGAIGSTANLPVITTTSGVLTAGAFGTGATNFCAGNDARLSDARTPASHTTGSHSDWPAAVSMTEVGYLDGVTSGIQSQLNAKGNGKILQVVYGSTTTEVTNTTETYADTGITATITPSATSSKVLVMVVAQIFSASLDTARCTTRLLRASTTISEKFELPYNEATDAVADVTHHVLDSPATTNATTYKLQFKVGGDDAGSVTAMRGSSPGTIVLMEVAA